MDSLTNLLGNSDRDHCVSACVPAAVYLLEAVHRLAVCGLRFIDGLLSNVRPFLQDFAYKAGHLQPDN